MVSSPDISERRSILTWVEFGRALVRAKTPHTCEERCEEINRSMQVVQTGKVLCMDGNYRGVWTIRSYLICRMRRDSIKRLDIGDMPVRKFMSLCLDQKRQVLQMSGGRFVFHGKIADVFSPTQSALACAVYT